MHCPKPSPRTGPLEPVPKPHRRARRKEPISRSLPENPGAPNRTIRASAEPRPPRFTGTRRSQFIVEPYPRSPSSPTPARRRAAPPLAVSGTLARHRVVPGPSSSGTWVVTERRLGPSSGGTQSLIRRGSSVWPSCGAARHRVVFGQVVGMSLNSFRAAQRVGVRCSVPSSGGVQAGGWVVPLGCYRARPSVWPGSAPSHHREEPCMCPGSAPAIVGWRSGRWYP